MKKDWLAGLATSKAVPKTIKPSDFVRASVTSLYAVFTCTKCICEKRELTSLYDLKERIFHRFVSDTVFP